MANSDGGLVQAVADNFDANISSQNGLKSTHGLAMLLTQPQSGTGGSSTSEDKINRLKQNELNDEIIPDLPIQRYTGPKKAIMPIHEINRSVLPLKF